MYFSTNTTSTLCHLPRGGSHQTQQNTPHPPCEFPELTSFSIRDIVLINTNYVLLSIGGPLSVKNMFSFRIEVLFLFIYLFNLDLPCPGWLRIYTSIRTSFSIWQEPLFKVLLLERKTRAEGIWHRNRHDSTAEDCLQTQHEDTNTACFSLSAHK